MNTTFPIGIKTRLVPSILLLAIAGLGASIVFSLTYAQQTVSNATLEISPPTQEVTADPGSTLQVKAKVRNKSTNQVTVKSRVDNFVAAGDEGQVALTEKDPNTLAGWSTVAPDQFVLKAGEQKEVTATVTLPRTAAGGHYGSIVFGTVPQDADPNSAKLAQEIASLFLVRVTGPVTEKVDIVGFSTVDDAGEKSQQYFEFGPITMQLRFNNSGNVHVRPTGLIAVTDMFGNKVKDVVLQGQNVLPGANRKVDVKLDNRWLVGKYKANAILVYGQKNESINAETTFYVFPIRIVLIGLFGLGFLYVIRKRLAKAFKALGGK